MKKFMLLVIVGLAVSGLLTETTLAASSSGCQGGGSFFDFPTWYQYLPPGPDGCPTLTQLTDVWLVGLAVIDIMLRIAMMVAVAFVLYGGFKYMTARGNVDRSTNARNTITDALTGLIIAIIATAVVTFVAGRFGP